MSDQRPWSGPPEPSPPALTEPFAPVAPEPFGPAAPGPGGFEQPPAPVRAAQAGGRATSLVLTVAVLVAATGVAFALGRMSAPTALSAAQAGGAAQGGPGAGGQGGAGGGLPGPSFDPNGNGNGPGSGGGFGDGGGRRFGAGGLSIQGTVTAVTPTSVTIRLASGQAVTFALGSTTAYHQQAAGSQSDVTAGKTVILKVGGRFGAGGAGGATAGTATDVTVVP